MDSQTSGRDLGPGAFRELPLGAVRPLGWLRAQLEVQAAGLTGHIEEVWKDLGPESGWKGGGGESWERGPYYLDGLVPLAHLLGDAGLLARARTWIEWMLRSQREDGFFGPADPKSRWGPDWWYLTPALKALAQHAEATGDPRVTPFMLRFFRHQQRTIGEVPLQQWARAREGEMDLVLQWLFRVTGERWLLDHAATLRERSLDWTGLFLDFPYATLPKPFQFRHETHVVNVAMALKYPAQWALWSGREDDRRASAAAIDALMRHHGQAHGMFSGDEHLAGPAPTAGVELCAVVEAMWSLAQLVRITGETAYADRLERVAFNALPAAFDGAMRLHQYDQQVNQVACTEAPRAWVDNGPRANCFGLEPNFGCCAANFHQGWPKFASHLWMATHDGGLAACAYAPAAVHATVRGGARAVVRAETRYPFGDAIEFVIGVDRPVAFPLVLRVPGWAQGATLDGKPVEAGTWLRIERSFSDGDRLTLALPRRVRAERRPLGALSLHAGPLLLALPIAHRWRLLPGERETWGDHEALPVEPWNWGLALSERDAAALTIDDRAWEGSPYSKSSYPLRVRVPARRVKGWDLLNHSAAPVPERPQPEGPPEFRDLVPYGSTILRLGEMPVFS